MAKVNLLSWNIQTWGPSKYEDRKKGRYRKSDRAGADDQRPDRAKLLARDGAGASYTGRAMSGNGPISRPAMTTRSGRGNQPSRAGGNLD